MGSRAQFRVPMVGDETTDVVVRGKVVGHLPFFVITFLSTDPLFYTSSVCSFKWGWERFDPLLFTTRFAEGVGDTRCGVDYGAVVTVFPLVRVLSTFSLYHTSKCFNGNLGCNITVGVRSCCGRGVGRLPQFLQQFLGNEQLTFPGQCYDAGTGVISVGQLGLGNFTFGVRERGV